jgi:hypothetical protein
MFRYRATDSASTRFELPANNFMQFPRPWPRSDDAGV